MSESGEWFDARGILLQIGKLSSNGQFKNVVYHGHPKPSAPVCTPHSSRRQLRHSAHPMATVTRAFLAFLAAPIAMGHSEEPAPAFAGVDPAARSAALEKMQRRLQGLANTVSSQAQELEAQRAHSAALEARLGEAEATLSRFFVHEGEGDGDRRPSAKATSTTSDVRDGTFRRAQEVPPDNC
jgi:hypothetical protein